MRVFATLVVLLLGTATCVYNATDVLVVMDTDIDPSVPIAITARLWRGGDASGPPSELRWIRLRPGSPPFDGGALLPASFGITPGAGPTDATVSLEIAFDAEGLILRRNVRFAFVPRQTTVVRIFITSRCAAPATGCRAPLRCTVQDLCEERGQTCGDDGRCTPVDVRPSRDRDAGFGDIAPPPSCGHYGERCCDLGASCASPLACVNNRCQRCRDPGEVCCIGPNLRTNGAVCATAAGACQVDGVCTDGRCSGVRPAADGSMCGPGDARCIGQQACQGGTCMPVFLPTGFVCNNTANICQIDGTCNATGTCSPITNQRAGFVCAPARNGCETDGTCNGTGTCRPRGQQPDGTPWGTGGVRRCCGGAPVLVNTTANCNVCAQNCAAGETCDLISGQYYCGCSTNAQCPGGVCRNINPGINHCACSTSCPAGSRCMMIAGPNYCTF